MYFDGSAVNAQCLNLDVYNTFNPHGDKDPVQHTVFAPPVHPHIYGVPFPEPLWERTPLAAVFQNV